MAKQNQSSQDEIPSRHWADNAADELIKQHPADKEQFVCASGISPSGVVHIGNFREVITVDFVVRALKDRGKRVRFIYSWDDYDAFRKVPANLPGQEALAAELRKPISKVTDPFPDGCTSYAGHFEKLFEGEISQLGVHPEYIRQNEMYRACRYAAGIRDALKNQTTIVAILNKARTENLPADWWCVSVFCKRCGKDTTQVTEYREPFTLHYRCKCGASDTIDFEKEEGVKLLWRVDWPMRWAREGVDFEPGGKDHSSQGGSFDTGQEIIKAVWKKPPPYYVQYDFVLAKGLGSKLSSSSGNLLTVSEALEIYEPAVIRWLFASRKPNLDFSIAFDLDVMKAYDEFDRTERFAYGAETGDEKKVTYERRIYELSTVRHERITPDPTRLPAQFPFRHLCNVLQIHQGNLDKAREVFSPSIKTALDRERFEARAKRAWKWITAYAPEEFKFQLRASDGAPVKAKYPQAVRELVDYLKTNPTLPAEDVIANRIFEIMKGNGIDAKSFFGDVYGILISKTHGPKLASFLIAIGPARAAEILERAL